MSLLTRQAYAWHRYLYSHYYELKDPQSKLGIYYSSYVAFSINKIYS